MKAHDAWGDRRRLRPLIPGAAASLFALVALSTSNKLQLRQQAQRPEAYNAALRGIRFQYHSSRGAPHSADGTESARRTSMVLESEAQPRFSGCRHSHPQDNSNIATLRPDLACRVHASGRHPELAEAWAGMAARLVPAGDATAPRQLLNVAELGLHATC